MILENKIKMGMHGANFFPLCLLLLLPFFSGSNRPGCPTRCGDLLIPSPFGVGSGSNCSLDPAFEIQCNTSTYPPKAYLDLRSTKVEVIEISGSQVRVKYPTLAVSCYQGDTVQNDLKIDLSPTPYTLSEDNWLTAVGCDDAVTVKGNAFAFGCLSFCVDGNGGAGACAAGGDNGYLPQYGCCRTPILKGTGVLVAHLSNSQGNWRSSKLFPCSYAFVGEKGENRFTYRLDGLQNLTTFLFENPRVTSTPLVLDWRIGTQNCSQASRNSTAFACQGNSICVDYGAGVGGYLCRCADGYSGNPYLAGTAGCQDIDECASASTNLCKLICSNTAGGYTCSCPKGYQGDGRRNGYGCIKVPPSKTISATIGLFSGLGFLLLLAACIWSYTAFQRRKNRKLREKFFKRNGGLLLQQGTDHGTLGKTNLFRAKELEKATDHFNESRILGQGGQGTVYKGMLSDGKIVAIKKSKRIDENQLEQFINEVAILSQINHRNVVKLLGCCLETEVPLLVYEFVSNGNLFNLIHDESTEFPITWSMRLKIASDVAGALAYLHSASSIPIHHRDVKSSNILLDEKYVAKVSDFGISRSFGVDETHLTTLVKGTFGYLDPEYFQSGQFTEKSDVYSFGMVLVELLTGQRPISGDKTEEQGSLATRFLESVETNNLGSILDVIVSEQGKNDEVIAVARIARKCLNLHGKMRPTMKEVATELESIRLSSRATESQRGKLHDVRAMLVMETEYTWTTSGSGAAGSSSDTCPLMQETV